MKNTILYALIFISAFVGTSFGIYSLNNKYVDIFQFDFRDAVQVAKLDSMAVVKADTTVVVDSLNRETVLEEKVTQFQEDLIEAKKELKKTSRELTQKEKEMELLRKQLENKNNAEHDEWFKSTLKLYEAMDVEKARQLIKKLPEEDARKLVYSMKRKKAAEILSSLDIETVKRLTRAEK